MWELEWRYFWMFSRIVMPAQPPVGGPRNKYTHLPESPQELPPDITSRIFPRMSWSRWCDHSLFHINPALNYASVHVSLKTALWNGTSNCSFSTAYKIKIYQRSTVDGGLKLTLEERLIFEFYEEFLLKCWRKGSCLPPTVITSKMQKHSQALNLFQPQSDPSMLECRRKLIISHFYISPILMIILAWTLQLLEKMTLSTIYLI